MLCAVVAFAQNVRPVPVGPPPGGEASLQTILNGIYGCTGCINAATNQQTTALWMLPGIPTQTIAPVLQAAYAADGDAVGLYTGNNLVRIFNPTAPAGISAGVQFNLNGTIDVFSTFANCTAGYVNCNTFTGISQGSFGFFMTDTTTGNTFFTEDSRNPNIIKRARALAYQQASNDRWAIAFEDGTDFDYNDRVISVESIVAVPEPGAVMLFGTVLALCATKLRRRK
jgi:hypothetical protein